MVIKMFCFVPMWQTQLGFLHNELDSVIKTCFQKWKKNSRVSIYL